jgi:hypothetical protein
MLSPIHSSLVDPHWRRCDISRWCVPHVLSSAACQTADDADRHIVITNDLAAQPDAGQASRWENVALGDSHAGGLTFEELNAARRATRISATGVQLVNSRILLQGQH